VHAAWFTAMIKDDLASATQVLVAFDPARPVLLLPGGGKAGAWQRWYRENVPVAGRLYLEYAAAKQE
jgi:hypothetical protein